MAGITVVDEEAYNASSPSYTAMLQKVKEKNPDVLYFASYLLDATTLMHQSRQVDLNPRFFTAAGTGFSTAEFPTEEKGAGKDAEYTISVTQWMPRVKWPGSRRSSPTSSRRDTARTRPTTRCRRTRRSRWSPRRSSRPGRGIRRAIRDASARHPRRPRSGRSSSTPTGRTSTRCSSPRCRRASTRRPPAGRGRGPVLPTPPWSAR